MRIYPLLFVWAACAGTPRQVTPPGPPPPSRAWTSDWQHVGPYAVQVQAYEPEDSDLSITFIVTGGDAESLKAADFSAAVEMRDQVRRCTSSGRVSVLPLQERTAMTVFQCASSVTGTAGLVMEIKGIRSKTTMNLKQS